MEQKMAPGTGLTARQKQLLDLAIKEPYILKTFYLSGGTALSYWYLHHRQSDDLDFFSTTPFDYARMTRWIRNKAKVIGYRDARFEEDYGFLRVFLRYTDGNDLLLDFHHYSNELLEPGIVWNGFHIDSLLDITVNKISTIATLPRTRDYIDVYFLFKRKQWTVEQLIAKTEKKFQEKIDILQLAKNFLKVTEYTDYPKMLIPFAEQDMYEFYEQLARKLKSNILK